MGAIDLLFNPDGFFAEEVELEKPMWRGALVVLVVAILSAINTYIMSSASSREIYRLMVEKGASVEAARGFAQFIQTVSVISAVIGAFIGWVLIAAILHGISALFGGEGKFTDTLKVTAYSFVPNIVVYPFTYYIATAEANIIANYGLKALAGSGVAIAGSIIGLAVLAWQFLLWRFGIKHARNLSGGDATIVAAIPAIVFALLSIAGLLHPTFQGIGGRMFK